MGTHPIFESDFDCLTDLIPYAMTENTERQTNDTGGDQPPSYCTLNPNDSNTLLNRYNGTPLTRSQSKYDQIMFFKKSKLFMLPILLGILLVVFFGGFLGGFVSQQYESSVTRADQKKISDDMKNLKTEKEKFEANIAEIRLMLADEKSRNKQVLELKAEIEEIRHQTQDLMDDVKQKTVECQTLISPNHSGSEATIRDLQHKIEELREDVDSLIFISTG